MPLFTDLPLPDDPPKTKELKGFIYNGVYYLRVIPGKRLHQSTLIWEVVNRGDVFALNMETGVLTVVPGKAQVEHFVWEITL